MRRGQGVRSEDQARSLAKFIFNETAAVQGTIIQPCSGIVTDGIQAIMQLLQGVVTYTSPVEAFATRIKTHVMTLSLLSFAMVILPCRGSCRASSTAECPPETLHPPSTT